MDKRKLTKAQKEIEREIEWYECPKSIARIMRRLGRWGFEFSGHGAGFGGEDFNLIKKLGKQKPTKKLIAYVNISDRGKYPKCSGYIYDDMREDYENLIETKEMKSDKFFPILKKIMKKHASDA